MKSEPCLLCGGLRANRDRDREHLAVEAFFVGYSMRHEAEWKGTFPSFCEYHARLAIKKATELGVPLPEGAFERLTKKEENPS